VDEEQRRIVDDLMWKGEIAMRDRGLSDAEIAAKKRQLQQMIEQHPPNDAQWEMLGRIDGGEPPPDLKAMLGKGSWIVRLAVHPLVSRFGMIATFALIGFLGGPAPGTHVGLHGVKGLLAGLAVGLLAQLLVEIAYRAHLRRRMP
jgi:hypothetical protein